MDRPQTAHEAGSWNQHRASTIAFAELLEGEPLSGRTANLVLMRAQESWLQEADLTEEFYRTFEGRVPAPLWAELAALRYRLKRA